MIQKFRLELEVDNEKSAYQIQQELVNAIKSQLAAEMEHVLNKLNIPDTEIIIIPKIELDLGKLPAKEYLQHFKYKFIKEFEKDLRAQINRRISPKLTDLTKLKESKTSKAIEVKTEIEALQFYLQKGYFPWWFTLKEELSSFTFSQLVNNKAQMDSFFKNLKTTIVKKVVKRLSALFEVVRFSRLYAEFSGSEKPQVKKKISGFEKHYTHREIKQIIEQAFFTTSRNEQALASLEKSETDLLQKKHIKKDEEKRFEAPELGKPDKKTTIKTSQKQKYETEFFETTQKQKQKQSSKRLHLSLFSYELVYELFYSFLKTGQFHSWADELIKSVKNNNFLKTNTEVLEYIFSYLKINYSTRFYNHFREIFTFVEIRDFILLNFSQNSVVEFIKFYFFYTQSQFTEIYNKLVGHYKNENRKIEYFKINKFIFSNSKAIEKEELEEKQLEKLYENFISNIEKQETVLEKLKNYISELVIKGNVPDKVYYFTKTNFEHLISSIDDDFFKELLKDAGRHYVFVQLFSENVVLSVLKLLFKKEFTLINSLLKEWYLILGKTAYKISFSKLGKQFSIIAFEIALQNISGKNQIKNKFYEGIKLFFKKQQPQLKFPEQFTKALAELTPIQVPEYKNYTPSAKAGIITAEFNANAVLMNAYRIGYQFVFYLKHGFLHSGFTHFTFVEFKSKLNEELDFILEEFCDDIADIQFNEVHVSRFIALAGREKAKEFLLKLTKTEDFEKKLFDEIEDSEALKQTVNEGDIKDKELPDELPDLEKELTDDIDRKRKELEKMFPDAQQEEVYEELIREKVDWVNEPEDEDKMFVKNAGLVVLCNFLSFLFKRTKLIERKKRFHKFVDESAQERAVLLTQYLAGGKEEFQENELILNKIICGWPIDKPIDTKIQLSEKEKKEADILINSAIKHWSVLGSTSPEGLRESFVQREGIIRYKNSSYNLKVEEKGIDVLLSKIPWSFQTLKFSWNKYIILVDWTV